MTRCRCRSLWGRGGPEILFAYEVNPMAWTDGQLQIPESGNGVPDILDEVKWGTDWLKKMQLADGSTALKVGEIVYAAAAPPSSDHNPRYYVPGCSSSTIASRRSVRFMGGSIALFERIASY